MPNFNCKALTPQGQVVRSRIEDVSRLACIRKLRRNGFTPISVTQTLSVNNTKKKKANERRNIKPEANFVKRNKKVKSKKATRWSLGCIK